MIRDSLSLQGASGLGLRLTNQRHDGDAGSQPGPRPWPRTAPTIQIRNTARESMWVDAVNQWKAERSPNDDVFLGQRVAPRLG